MEVREKYIARMLNDPADFNLSEAKFIHSAQVFTARAVRLRCQYTCSHTRQSDTTPPHSPSADETRGVLDEYKFGLMLRREDPAEPRDHLAFWPDFSRTVLGIERECLVRGYPRAFALGIGNCLYVHHDDSLRPCDYAGKARPTLEAIGVELKETLEMVHWEGYLHRETGDPFQVFALLLLE
ncbi:hypothetical protein HZA57_07405 [Candidatus Poribacteria bacterium]|nr:hypothetical protein [Candidatus Poribacteria bacterium]